MDAYSLIKYKSALKTKLIDTKPAVWDIVRDKWIIITPEELVRQCLIHYLISEKGYGIGKIAVEKQIKYHQLNKRFDIVIYDKQLRPYILIECKAPDIEITPSAIEQLLIYQEMLNATYIWLSNGHDNLIYDCHDRDNYHRIISIPMAPN